MNQIKFPNTVIKSCYLKAFDENRSIEERKTDARGVVDTIINGISFEDMKVIELFNETNHELTSQRKKVYFNTFTGKLKFLVDKGLLSKNLSLQYDFIYGEAGKYSTAHPRFKKGDSRNIIIIQIYLNNILFPLLDKFEESKDYLIPMSVLEKKDSRLYNRVNNRIDSFWNIRKDSYWYQKYSTIIRFICIILFFPIWPISLLICLIEIYNTNTLVFNNSLKRKRKRVYNTLLFLTIILGFFNLYSLQKMNDEGGKFDPNSLYPLKSTLGASHSKDSILSKKIDLLQMKENESINIIIHHSYRNVGFKNILYPKASLDAILKKNEILFIGKLISQTSVIVDTIIIENITKPYNIEYLDGYLYSPFYKNYGYHKILDDEKYIRILDETENNFKLPEFQIVNFIDNFKTGNFSRGLISSKFKIELHERLEKRK